MVGDVVEGARAGAEAAGVDDMATPAAQQVGGRERRELEA